MSAITLPSVTIQAQQISKVIINGEWLSVELGSFEVVEMAFVDETGQQMHDELDTMAYSFTTTNRDHYYGPLSAITLFKLADY